MPRQPSGGRLPEASLGSAGRLRLISAAAPRHSAPAANASVVPNRSTSSPPSAGPHTPAATMAAATSTKPRARLLASVSRMMAVCARIKSKPYTMPLPARSAINSPALEARAVSISSAAPVSAVAHSAQRMDTLRVSHGPTGCANVNVSMKVATGSTASVVGDSGNQSGCISDANTVKNGRSNSSDKAVKKTSRRMRVSAMARALSRSPRSKAAACTNNWSSDRRTPSLQACRRARPPSDAASAKPHNCRACRRQVGHSWEKSR